MTFSLKQAAGCLLALSLSLSSVTVTAASATRTSAFTYDAVTGWVTKTIVEPGNSALCLVTEYSYDAYGNKLTATTRNCNGSSGEAAAPSGDPVIAARTNTNLYDARGQFPVTSSNALAQSETKTFDPKWGTPLSLTGPNGLLTTWTYDSFGRKNKETRADGTQTKWDYLYCSGINGGTTPCPTIGGAAATWLLKETPLASDGVTQNGPISTAYYDALNRPLRKETQGYDGGGTSTTVYQDTQYDSLGRPYKQSRPYYTGQTAYWTTLTYDAIGRIVQETAPDASVSSTAYNGLTTTLTNAKSQTRTTVKNSQGQIVRVTDAQSQSITYTYDPFGNLASTTDPLGKVVSLTYDLRGRKTQMRDPDMGTWTYAYDALGQLLRQTDAKAQVATLSYDKLGRLIARNEADLISTWYYDSYKGGVACNKGIGKLCQSETSTGYTKTTTYDSLGRQSASAVTIDVPTPYSSAVTYDANGRVATQTYPTGLGVRYVYTTLGYLKEVRSTSTSNALYWQADSQDAEGHLRQQTYGNGIQTTQTYTPSTGRISAIVAGAGNGVQNLAYQYDALGNVTSRSDANQSLTESFVYDSLNRLKTSTVNSSGAGIVTQTFDYDALGGITSKSDLGTYTYPANGSLSSRPHAVAQITLAAGGTISFAYDANGALMTQSQIDANGQAVLAKSRNQFYTSFGMPQSMGQGATSAAFYYGPEHQRVKQLSSVQGTTIYVNPGNEGALFYEKDVKPDNSIEQRHFISAGGQAVAIVKYTTQQGQTTVSTRYLQRDHLGSVTAVTNEQGAVTERLAYEAFGKRRFVNGTADPANTILPSTTDRGFTDHEMLDEIGLVHMNGRVYDPLVGRFLSADPKVQDPKALQSFNRYAYVWNNPLNMSDPSGFEGVISSYNYNTGSNVSVPSYSHDYVSNHQYQTSDGRYGSGGSAKTGAMTGLKYENGRIVPAAPAAATNSPVVQNTSVNSASDDGDSVTSNAAKGTVNTLSISLRPPAWAAKLIYGSEYIGQGGSIGLAYSVPGTAAGEFDLGGYLQLNGGGMDIGTGKYSVGVGVQQGNIRNGLNGRGAEYSFNDGVGGMSISLDDKNRVNGVGMHVGPGYNVGGSGTETKAISLKQTIIDTINYFQLR